MLVSLDYRLPVVVDHDTHEPAIPIFRILKAVQTFTVYAMVGVRASIGVNLHTRAEYDRAVDVHLVNVHPPDGSYRLF